MTGRTKNAGALGAIIGVILLSAVVAAYGTRAFLDADVGISVDVWESDAIAPSLVEAKSIFPGIKPYVDALYRKFEDPSVAWFIWRPALHLYLVLGAMIVLVRRSGDRTTGTSFP